MIPAGLCAPRRRCGKAVFAVKAAIALYKKANAVRDPRESFCFSRELIRGAMMRLDAHSQAVIREAVEDIFGPDAVVYVFGSRIDDAARGGDIDLLVTVPAPLDDVRRRALTLTARLQMRLGDQPIDVLVVDPQTELGPVHSEALRTGVPLA